MAVLLYKITRFHDAEKFFRRYLNVILRTTIDPRSPNPTSTTPNTQ